MTLCTGSQYTSGSWVERIQNHSSENFPCCSNYEGRNMGEKRPFLEPVCLSNEFKPPYVPDHGCLCQDYFYLNNRTDFSTDPLKFHPRSINYVWEPDNCVLSPWNASRFCELLGKRKILFAGDSTMSQTYYTMQAMIYFHFFKDTDCQRNMIFEQSDRLVDRGGRHAKGADIGVGRGVPLIEVAEKHSYVFDMLVISAGFHVHPSEYETSKNVSDMSFAQHFFPLLRNEINHIYRKMPNLRVIYKTGNVPHKGCADVSAPDNAITNSTALHRLNANHVFNWNAELDLDLRFVNFARENDISVIRMDPIMARPDGHARPESGLCAIAR